tara:strand:+ start:124 stop:459 length:336 start_codon:yes stop_codon:yes gene_type:complete
MKKLLGIVVLGLLLVNNALSEEIVLRCKVNEFSNDFPMNQRFSLEINLEEKKLYIEDIVHNIEIIGDRAIVSDERHGQKIKLDRYDGYFYFDYDPGQTKIDGYCKKFEKIF